MSKLSKFSKKRFCAKIFAKSFKGLAVFLFITEHFLPIQRCGENLIEHLNSGANLRGEGRLWGLQPLPFLARKVILLYSHQASQLHCWTFCLNSRRQYSFTLAAD